jgi:outer membrane lipoprotein-sorting protein
MFLVWKLVPGYRLLSLKGRRREMNAKLIIKRLVVAGLLTMCLTGFALQSVQAMTPEEILKKSDEGRGSIEGIEWEIAITSIESGREQQRSMKVSARSFKSLAEYLAPANVKGQKILMVDRNMWFAKPGLSKAVPISPRQKLLGNAANGDIASTNYAGDYKITQASEDAVGKEPCYLFDLAAVDKKATYDRIKYWISKERLAGVKAEFYTVSGKMFKTAVFEYNNSITIDGEKRLFISKMIITSAIMKQDVTTMSFHKVVFKTIPDSLFNLNLLVK